MTTDEALTPFAEGVWVSTGPSRFLGLRLTVNMAALRLRDGSLLLYSPLAMTPARRAAVEALGAVKHIYSPNLYHHLRIGDWSAAFPSAKVHAPKALTKKRPDLRIDRFHGAPEPAFEGVIDELHIDGFRLDESDLFYRPSNTLVSADLVHNVGRPPHWWTKLYTQMMGFYDRIALSSMIRWTAFSDRAAARLSIDQMLSLPVERLFVGHGAHLTTGAKEAISAAYSWLPPVGR